VDEVDELFEPYDLAELEVAEYECPWGEMAMNYRMMYLAARADAASPGFTEEGRRQAANDAYAIWLKLFGPQPSPKPPKAGDFAQS
jgi:hypothetical protein